MSSPWPQSEWKGTPWFTLGGTLVLAAGLFFFVPLTQWLGSVEAPDVTVRTTALTLPPPESPPPPETPEAPPPDAPPTPPDFTPDLPPIEIEPLDLVLSPGMGEALAMGAAPTHFTVEGAAVAAIEAFFTFSDLNKTPRLLTTPPFRFPPALVRRGVREGEVVVELEILPDGSTRFHHIVSSTHHELEPIARRMIEQARFSPPLVNGEPQRVRGQFPLVLQH